MDVIDEARERGFMLEGRVVGDVWFGAGRG
jgi:hypothetical protein